MSRSAAPCSTSTLPSHAGGLGIPSLNYLASNPRAVRVGHAARGFAANTVGTPPVEYQPLSRRGGRYPAAAISVAAKRLGLGTGAQRFVTDSSYLFERRAEGA